MMTPYTVENAQQYLNEGIIAIALSDNDAALLVEREMDKLFNHIHE